MSLEHTDLIAVLKNTRLLSILSQPELQLLAQRTVRKLFSAGELLFSEGEPCHGLNIVSKGKVRIFKISIGGREQVLAMEFPGDTVTEIPVFDGGPYRSRWRIRRSPSSHGTTFRHFAWNIQR